jgi:long-chain fatty acid transport protein
VTAGYAYDETPVPSADLRTPRIPDADRQWLSAGVSFNPNERWAVRFSAAHLFVDDVNLDVTVDLLPATLAPSGTFTDRLVGSIGNANADIVSLQIDYNFAERE